MSRVNYFGCLWIVPDYIGKNQSILKSKYAKSSYVSKILIWHQKDNKFIKDFEKFAIYLEFFSQFVDFPKNFIENNNVDNYHIQLIRRMTFDYDLDSTNLEYKRPYGNSNVLCDVADECINSQNKKLPSLDYGILVDDREDFLNKVHIQTMRIFVKALKELYFPYTRFNRINQNMQWNPEIDIKKVREYKLKRILK